MVRWVSRGVVSVAWIAMTSPLACDAGSDDDDTDGSGIEVVDLAAAVSEQVVTAVTVTWATSEETSCGLECVAGDATLTVEPGDPAAEHERVVLLRASTTWDIRPVCDGAGEADAVTVTTGSLPGELPTTSVTGGGHDRYSVLPVIGNTTAATILDPEGNIVWYRIDNRDLDIFRARLSRDGRSVLYNAASVSGDPADDSQLMRVSLDGSEVEAVDVPLLAHDFVELPDGTLAAVVVEFREYEGEDLRGDSIVEVAPDGTLTTVWSAWDCWDPAETLGTDLEFGWTWVNTLDYDEARQMYLLGSRNFSSIIGVERDTGACAWAIGGTVATVELTGGSSPFLHQHQFELTPDDHLIVFDNDGSAGMVSRVIEYDVDWDARSAEQVWSYTADPPVYTFVLGDVARMPDGDTLVDWSGSGQIQRVTPEGDVRWQLNTELGYVFGFMSVEESVVR